MIKTLTCYEMLIKNCDREGSIIFENHTISMETFINHIDNFAHSLKKLEFKKGDVLTIYMPTCPQSLVAFYACSKLGIIANIVHPLIPLEKLKDNLKKTKSKGLMFYDILIKDQSDLKKLHQKCIIKCSISDYVNIRKLAYAIFARTKSKPTKQVIPYYRLVKHSIESEYDSIDGTGTDVVCTMHSGGTSGDPKIVKLQNFAFNELSVSLEKMYTRKERKNEYGIVALPIFHAYGLGVAIHTCLTNQYSLILMPKFWPRKINAYMKRYNVSFFACVPIMLKKMMECNNFGGKYLERLKDIWCGGDVVSESFVEYMDMVLHQNHCTARVMRGYGLTETSSVCCVNTFEHYKKKSCGKPIPNTTIEIWDDDNNVLPPNTVGEIVVSNNCMMQGYLNPDEGFKEQVKFRGERPDFDLDDDKDKVIEKDGISIRNGKRFVKTGDLGILDEDGYLFVYDRKKRSIKISAVNVFPSEIEETVKKLDFINEACAVGYHYNDKTFVKLFVTLNKDCTMGENRVKKEITTFCENNMIKYSVPRVVEIIDEMPRTNIGKIDYKKLI